MLVTENSLNRGDFLVFMGWTENGGRGGERFNICYRIVNSASARIPSLSNLINISSLLSKLK